MNDSILRDCWEKILLLDAARVAETPWPLNPIEPCCEAFGLSPMPELTAAPAPAIPDAKPSFKELTEEILLALRLHIYAGTEPAAVSTWAETLMRFCEVRYRSLKSRARQRCGSKAAAKLRLLHLAAFLMDQGMSTNDPRFLSTVLKLVDLKWVVDTKTIGDRLDVSNSHLVSALFEFRVILTTEYAMGRLRKGETI